MDLRDYVRLFRRRWRLIALCALLGIAAALAATVTQSKVYTADFQFFVSAQGSPATATGSGDISNAYTGGLFTQQRVKSYADDLQSPRLGELVVRDLGLKRSPTSLANQVTATAPLDTVLINRPSRTRAPSSPSGSPSRSACSSRRWSRSSRSPRAVVRPPSR